MVELEFSEHAKFKIEERNIPPSEVSTVLKTPSTVFLDLETGYFIAIGRAAKPDHYLIIVYIGLKDKIKVITVIDTTKMEMIKRREEEGRWVRIR